MPSFLREVSSGRTAEVPRTASSSNFQQIVPNGQMLLGNGNWQNTTGQITTQGLFPTYTVSASNNPATYVSASTLGLNTNKVE